MSILTNLFSGGAADLVKSVGGVVDNLTTSKEEKLQLKNDLEKIIIEANKVQQEAVTSRWEADMKSGDEEAEDTATDTPSPTSTPPSPPPTPTPEPEEPDA